MFQAPRYIQNSFSIIFPRVREMRRRVNAFEDLLQGEYTQPQSISVPDDFAPEVPRIIFESEHRYSQIVISQVSIALNVTYSPDYQLDATKRRPYLEERIGRLFSLLDVIREAPPAFSGLTTQVDLQSKETDDAAILRHLAALFLRSDKVADMHDLQIKVTNLRGEQFFSNLVIQNYRAWPEDALEQNVHPLRRADAIDRGCRIVGDYNDRYAFNEQTGYRTTRETAAQILAQGLAEIEAAVAQLTAAPGAA